MSKQAPTAARREDSLTLERIIDAAVELLDVAGEAGLTFRALSERLSTGPGAIYWHVANKAALLTAACDSIVTRTLHSALNSNAAPSKPKATIRALALALFDTIDTHPWVGAALTSSASQLPLLRIIEPVGQQLRALGVPAKEQRPAVGALLAYILGVSAQNAANGQYARAHSLDRTEFLTTMAATWSELDPQHYPFTRSIAHELPNHDDRADYLAGIDLILKGIDSSRR